MLLSKLLLKVNISATVEDKEVTLVTDNSKKVVAGCIFVCIKGANFDGHSVAKQSLEKGACAVVVSRDLGLKNQIIVKNTRLAYAHLCAAFFSNPEKKLQMIGVTGTNGKTTTCFVLFDMLKALGYKVGMLGTVQNVVGDKILPASLTTPDPYDLFSLLNEMVICGTTHCVMEVSSQALHQFRVAPIHFSASVFTNLTGDHLDYHGNFENYVNAKKMLFNRSDIGVFNIDDDYAEEMMADAKCRIVTVSAKENHSDYSAKNIIFKPNGVQYEIVSDTQIGRVHFAIPGEFSVYNSMCALVCLLELGFELDTLLEVIAGCKSVPGRMEVVKADVPYTIIIDYAHTAGALENALKALRQTTVGNIITVFGCGGDRDKTKRPIMGDIATQYSDITIITSDNPRSENPMTIIEEILAGVSKSHNSKVIVEANRTKAIEKAMSLAKENDVILLAGKGHETYQILASGKIHYDEREIINELLK